MQVITRRRLQCYSPFCSSLVIAQLVFTCATTKEASKNETFLVDDSPDTCAVFQDDDSAPRYTHFRVRVPDDGVVEMNLNITGANLGCGHGLYVTLLPEDDAEKWTGRWKVCPLIETSTSGRKESCLYHCRCSGSCHEIQIIKTPMITSERSWELCYICFVSNITVKGCSFVRNGCAAIYHVQLTPEEPIFDVYCNTETDGGGWTVIMRRMDGSENFSREWEDYKNGFGSLSGEFYAGHDFVHKLTTADDRQYSLRIDLEDYNGERIFAFYTDFSTGHESDNYRLHVRGFAPNSTIDDAMHCSNGSMFSTSNHDNDAYEGNRAAMFGPWWMKACGCCYLFAPYGEYPQVPSEGGIMWTKGWNKTRFAKRITMMVRPNN